MHHLILKPNAIQMAKDAYDWYEVQQNDLGELFLASLNDCLQELNYIPKQIVNSKKIIGKRELKNFLT
jgi:hypothetical protein